MTTFVVPLSMITFAVIIVGMFSKTMACLEVDSCYSTRMKIFLDSASSFLNQAHDLNEGFPEKRVSCSPMPMDCDELLRCGHSTSGSYEIWPRSRITENKIQVFCDMVTDGGGWTVFQRRGDYGRPKDYFYNVWSSYKTGFGQITQDFWLGNDNIYALTNQRLQSLRVDMKDLENEQRYAVYDNFWIDGEEYDYTLHVRGYTGDANDAFSGHSESKFTTKDRDNDIYEEGNCAELYKGGWWYSKCHSSNLNGLYLNGSHASYADGIEWSHWKHQNYSLPFVEMKIRPTYSISREQH